MPGTHRWMIGITVALVPLMGLLAGCPKESDPDSSGSPQIGVPEPLDAEAVPEAEAAGQAGKLGDIIAHMPASFAATVTITGPNGQTNTMRLAIQRRDGKLLRMKSEPIEEKTTTVFDYEAQKMYSWNTESGEGVVLPLTEAEADTPETPYADIDSELRIAGSAVVDGVDCWVVETTNEQGQAITTYYGKSDGLVRKVTRGDTTLTYTYSQVGEVSDDEFAVPADVTLHEMPQMPAMPTGTGR